MGKPLSFSDEGKVSAIYQWKINRAQTSAFFACRVLYGLVCRLKEAGSQEKKSIVKSFSEQLRVMR